MYYFAYAANLSLRQMSRLCPESRAEFTATLPNYTLAFTGWSRQWRGGVATLRRSTGAKVAGAVYDIPNRDLTSLDRHEGYPTARDRISVKVITESDDFVEAITYIDITASKETPPSQEYLSIIRQGYKDWGILAHLSRKQPQPP